MTHKVEHANSALAAATNAVVDLLDAGSGDPTLVFYAGGTGIGSAGTAAATLTMDGTAAFGAANGTTGIATAATIASDTNATGNASAVAHAGLCDGDGTIIIYCTVEATSAGDIAMSNGLTVGAGDTVSCSSLTYQAIANPA